MVNIIFLIENPVLVEFLKIIKLQKQSLLTFGTALIHIKIQKTKNPPPTHKQISNLESIKFCVLSKIVS